MSINAVDSFQPALTGTMEEIEGSKDHEFGLDSVGFKVSQRNPREMSGEH